MNQSIVCSVCHSPLEYNENLDCSCPCCDHKISAVSKKDSFKTLIFSLTALIFYLPANLLPVMSIEMYGQKNSSTIWQGIISLSEGGDLILAIIVFLASMLIPFFKLLVLFYLSFSINGKNQKFKTKLFHFIEKIGPWSMLDIFLVAVLVAIIKFGSVATVSVGEGAFMFLLVVIFTMLASSNFDPNLIWKKDNEKK